MEDLEVGHDGKAQIRDARQDGQGVPIAVEPPRLGQAGTRSDVRLDYQQRFPVAFTART